jgi:DNA-binding SARP family transcriptional activator
VLRRVASLLGLTASLAGLPVILNAAAGPPSLAGLPSWQWLRDGLRDQYLPADPILHTLGLLAWSLWGYALIVAGLRVLAVLAARRRLAGAAALLALSNVVTLAPVRGLLDASIGVSLLAASTRPTATSTATAAPVAVVRTVQPQAARDTGGWDRARPLLHDAGLDTIGDQPTLAQPDPPPLSRAAPTVAAQPEETAVPARPPAGTPTRTYSVEDGDSLWRIAERELGDGLRWKEIWTLNQGRDMGGGRVFRHSGLILPGWLLHLPVHEQPPTTPPLHRDHQGASPGPPSYAPTTAPPSTTIPPANTATTEQRPPSSVPSASAPARHPRHRGHDVLELPSGSLVGFSLAAGIAFALALLRLRRRARRRLGHPGDLAEPEVGQTMRRLARFAHQRTTINQPDEDDPNAPPPRAPFAPSDWRTIHPGRVDLADRDGQEVLVDLVGHGASTITGPRAADAARAAIVGLASSVNEHAAQIILASTDLLAQTPDFPGLHRIPDLALAVEELERHVLGRARLFEHYDAPDFQTMRAEHPDDQQPALLLVCDQPLGEHTDRLAALLAQGPRLGIGALLVSDDVELAVTAHIQVDDHRRIQTASPSDLGEGQLVGARILRLSEDEATELLGVVAASRSDPAERPATLWLTLITDQRTASTVPPTPPIPVPAEPSPTPPPLAATEPLIRVRLLGAYTIEATQGIEIATGLRTKAREALAYCLLHPDGRTSEQIIDQVFPDVELARGPQQFWKTMTNIRTVLRNATGVEKLPAVERAGPLYRPDPEVFQVDVWQLEAAFHAAHDSRDEGELLAALERVADCYRANLLESPAYEWAESLREELRRRAVDALARLADLHHKAGNPDRALAALEQAINADPYAEELYQRIMRLQGGLGRSDAVRRTFHMLENRLDELDLDPSDATVGLANTLHADRQARAPRPLSLRLGPPRGDGDRLRPHGRGAPPESRPGHPG